MKYLPMLFVAILFQSTETYADPAFTMLLNKSDCIVVAVPSPDGNNMSELRCPATYPMFDEYTNTFELENGIVYRGVTLKISPTVTKTIVMEWPWLVDPVDTGINMP